MTVYGISWVSEQSPDHFHTGSESSFSGSKVHQKTTNDVAPRKTAPIMAAKRTIWPSRRTLYVRRQANFCCPPVGAAPLPGPVLRVLLYRSYDEPRRKHPMRVHKSQTAGIELNGELLNGYRLASSRPVGARHKLVGAGKNKLHCFFPLTRGREPPLLLQL
jgi:hypothetical protein